MQEVRLTIKKRAFPSRGRVRINAAHLPDLDTAEGEHADLVNEATGKTVTATIIADTMVPKGQVRVSAEDLAALGLDEGNEVLVVKTPPLHEKAKKVAADANASLSRGVDKLDAAVRKTADDVKSETKKTSDKIGKAARKTAAAAKKEVKKVTGSQDDL